MTELLARVADLEELQLDAMLERVPEYESREASMDECVLPEVYLENYRGLAHPYVLKRGFDLDTLRAWEIGYDEEQKRVVMPVRNRGRQLVGAVGRGVGRNPRPKYLNYWKFEKGLYLFGEHLVTEGAVVVVEGPLDALRVWQEFAKVKRHVNVVALMGAKATWKQCEKLTRLTDQLVLFLDNDAAGWEGQTDLVKKLRKTMLITAVRYPDVIDGDPDTLGAEVVAMIDNADLLV
jgi:DNA primase